MGEGPTGKCGPNSPGADAGLYLMGCEGQEELHVWGGKERVGATCSAAVGPGSRCLRLSKYYIPVFMTRVPTMRGTI